MGNSSIIIAISLLLVAFLLTVVMLPKLIKYLHYLKFGQEIRQEGPQSHIHKKGTPTMGGISFILAIVVALIIAMFLNSENIKYYLLFYFNLSHHTCFFMFKNVTVVHISTLLIKLNYKSYFFVRLNIYSIFPSALLWRRRITVS